jgi:hypothetical protein
MRTWSQRGEVGDPALQMRVIVVASAELSPQSG